MRIKKMLPVLTLLMTLMLAGTSMVHASLEKPDVYVNNQKLDISAGMGSAGVTYVPFRPIFEKFNMKVTWDKDKKSVTATNGSTTIVLTHNSYEAYVNGKKEKLIAPPFLDPTDGLFNVNLRFVAETLGAKVTWAKKGNDAAIYIEDSNINKN
ncbi:copper amine oxidase N-terminal domain-containing protein [Paenibacillus terrae]|uniref:Copper amine oxidase-like N-terminal domain-containing protein n=1 Tax=Paenibacillus terrae TaxID=159743 RepID=A0A0D7X8G7_9BACL|nr:copper amine oxidase N-terminal domain-containing protein [Paenibacillus terrae]KJD47429.1 hypothetical protein QD47_00270 [Paenibacillus terrae]